MVSFTCELGCGILDHLPFFFFFKLTTWYLNNNRLLSLGLKGTEEATLTKIMTLKGDILVD